MIMFSMVNVGSFLSTVQCTVRKEKILCQILVTIVVQCSCRQFKISYLQYVLYTTCKVYMYSKVNYSILYYSIYSTASIVYEHVTRDIKIDKISNPLHISDPCYKMRMSSTLSEKQVEQILYFIIHLFLVIKLAFN